MAFFGIYVMSLSLLMAYLIFSPSCRLLGSITQHQPSHYPGDPRPWLIHCQTYAKCVPPLPLCPSYALVQATLGVGTIFIWDLIQFGTKCSAAT